ncbi:hypothetical protein [Acetobacter vaccinii]|uniref:Uncharacterized protein n=1 Tax=Acetobacter vaccinii TaxID=2592655 RepID=A0A5C1YMC0_9PROT|nr:hypothetical protein [Acetobacter vaccinii]QEO17474.1 hypothetical protein FLP30_06875 [Acetobacter vaccinii]
MLVSATVTYTDVSRPSVASDSTDTNASTQAIEKEASSVEITLSQAGQDYLASGSSLASASMSSAQQALGRLDQLIRSDHSDAKQQAEERVNILKAQMRQLMQIKALLSHKELAQQLAQLAHQLAAAVAQYMQSGGGSAANTAVGTVVLSSPQNGTNAQTPQSDQNTTAQAEENTQAANTATDEQASSSGNQSDTNSDDHQGFAQTVQTLAEQIKNMLQESKKHLEKQDVLADSDASDTQSTLQSAEQLATQV